MWKRQRAIKPIECQACYRNIEVGQVIINHHVSYYPEKTIQVHASCHIYIHVHKSLRQDLQPDLRQLIRWYRQKGVLWRFSTNCFPYQFENFMFSIDKSGSFTRIR